MFYWHGPTKFWALLWWHFIILFSQWSLLYCLWFFWEAQFTLEGNTDIITCCTFSVIYLTFPFFSVWRILFQSVSVCSTMIFLHTVVLLTSHHWTVLVLHISHFFWVEFWCTICTVCLQYYWRASNHLWFIPCDMGTAQRKVERHWSILCKMCIRVARRSFSCYKECYLYISF